MEDAVPVQINVDRKDLLGGLHLLLCYGWTVRCVVLVI